MAQKMTGALVFDERTDRYDIRFDLNSYYGACIAVSALTYSCGASGSRPGLSTATTGILWVSEPRT